MKQFNVDRHAAYEALKNAANSLFERKFSYKGIHEATQKEKIVKSRWVSRIAYVDSAGILELVLPDIIHQSLNEAINTSNTWTETNKLPKQQVCDPSIWIVNSVAQYW